MNHKKALETKASERYLLGEMSDLERHLFEEHFFLCEECAEDVETGIGFHESARAVFAEYPPKVKETKEEHTSPEGRRGAEVWQEQNGWFDWLRPASLIPLAASVSLAFMVGYQSLVTIPTLRKLAAPAVVTPAVLMPATRGDLPGLTVPASGAPLAVSLYPSASVSRVAYELKRHDGTIVHSGNGPAPAAGAPLVLFFPTESLKQAGEYTVLLRDASAGQPGPVFGEYRFEIKKQ